MSRRLPPLLLNADFVVLRYEPLQNLDPRPGRARAPAGWRDGLRSGEKAILVHSHPSGRGAPSEGDLAARLLSPTAIFSVAEDRLRLFAVGRRSYRE